MRTALVLLAAVVVVALPFLFERPPSDGTWEPGDPVLVVISPHNEAIRYEFARGFNEWRMTQGKSPVKVDWRVVGGTSEISRYLNAEMQASFKAWWEREGREWPRGGSDVVTHRSFDPEGADPALVAVREALRAGDDSKDFGTGIDLFFGGGSYDHGKAAREGLTVAPWSEGVPERVVRSEKGHVLIPEGRSGEEWRTDTFFGTALSTFGIVSNLDRLEDLGVAVPPSSWEALADPVYRGQLGVADPTKSGSISKAFEMMVHRKIIDAVRAAGYVREDVTRFEEDPESAPADYKAAIASGWVDGLNMVRRIGANARYFTDSAPKVPIDVSTGNAAVGLAIDFFGRYQAETSRAPDGTQRMVYRTPEGGSSVSADPISLLRGAPHREVAVEFIEYVLSASGQKLWNYRPGTPGGPEKFALRRLPIRRDFYPSEVPEFQEGYERHRPHTSDPLGDPTVNPYALAETFEYRSRWTGRHFGIHRLLIRAMCLDSGEELRAAWNAIQAAGGERAVPEAMAEFEKLPPGLNWTSALGPEYGTDRQMEFMREWVIFFRRQYRLAKQLAEASDA